MAKSSDTVWLVERRKAMRFAMGRVFTAVLAVKTDGKYLVDTLQKFVGVENLHSGSVDAEVVMALREAEAAALVAAERIFDGKVQEIVNAKIQERERRIAKVLGDDVLEDVLSVPKVGVGRALFRVASIANECANDDSVSVKRAREYSRQVIDAERNYALSLDEIWENAEKEA